MGTYFFYISPSLFYTSSFLVNFSLFYAKTLNRYEINFSETTLSNMKLQSVYVPKQ